MNVHNALIKQIIKGIFCCIQITLIVLSLLIVRSALLQYVLQFFYAIIALYNEQCYFELVKYDEIGLFT